MRHITRATTALCLLGATTILPALSGHDDPVSRALATTAYGAESPSITQLIPDAELQPDIFVIMIDDHAYIPDQRVLERLPNTKKVFLDGGIRFEQMHAETPLCSPSRASLLTGQNTLRHGVVENDGNPMNQERTLPVALDAAGYHTSMVGKYLNRWNGSKTPPGWDNMAMAKGSYRPAFFRNDELVNFKPKYVDDAYRDQVAEWTREAPLDEPIFMLASVRAPHVDQCVNDKDKICYTPRVMEQDVGAPECADIPDFQPPSYRLESDVGPPQQMPDWPDGWQLQSVCESLLVIDRMVGDIVAEQAQRDRPAYFIYMSDNGMAWGQHGNPFKRVPWSTQMPFYMAGPGIEAGTTAALQSLIDVPVTIADMAGAEMPYADGETFLPLLAGGEGTRDEMLEVMDGMWNGIRTDDLHYVRWDDGTTQLFDYRSDPWMMENLVDIQPEVAERLDERLEVMLEASRP